MRSCAVKQTVNTKGKARQAPRVRYLARLRPALSRRRPPLERHGLDCAPRFFVCSQRRATFGAQEIEGGAELEAVPVPKAAVITHPRPAWPVTGVKRSRMVAFR